MLLIQHIILFLLIRLDKVFDFIQLHSLQLIIVIKYGLHPFDFESFLDLLLFIVLVVLYFLIIPIVLGGFNCCVSINIINIAEIKVLYIILSIFLLLLYFITLLLFLFNQHSVIILNKTRASEIHQFLFRNLIVVDFLLSSLKHILACSFGILLFDILQMTNRFELIFLTIIDLE